jgi:hypothetical protein
VELAEYKKKLNESDTWLDAVRRDKDNKIEVLSKKVEELEDKINGQEKAHQLELQIIGGKYQAKVDEVAKLKGLLEEVLINNAELTNKKRK